MNTLHHPKIDQKFEDSPMTVATVKHGYYQVGDKLFNNKLTAVIEASRSQQSMSWNFSHNVFERQAQMPRLSVPIQELYRQRALQLRDQYDYIILAFSGGADSDAMVKAFLDNDIRVDEIWSDYSSKELIEKSGYVLDPYSRDPSNMPAEYFLVMAPELEKIHRAHPEIKIHVSDSLGDGSGEDKNDSILVASSALGHGGIKRHRYIQDYVNKIGGGRKIGLVLGVDKMIPITNGDRYGFVFTDNAVLNKGSAIDSDDSRVEYFYWTPDFPQIVTEQAHRVWDYLHANHEFMKIRMAALRGSNWMDREKTFDNIIKQICYPDWDFGKLQVNKGLNFENPQYQWINSFHAERFFQSSRSFMMSILNVVDKSKYFDPRYPDKAELRPFYNFHSLGTMPSLNTFNFKKDI